MSLPARGARVCLRRFRAGDAVPLLAYRSDPQVARFQSWAPMGPDQAAAFVADMARITPLLRPGHWAQIALADPASDALLGDIGVFLRDDGQEAELGITLARAAQGQGRAEEAVALATALIFAETAAQSILGIADIRNHASLRLLARAGFVAEHEAVSGEGDQQITERFHRLVRPGTP